MTLLDWVLVLSAVLSFLVLCILSAVLGRKLSSLLISKYVKGRNNRESMKDYPEDVPEQRVTYNRKAGVIDGLPYCLKGHKENDSNEEPDERVHKPSLPEGE